MIDLKNWAFHRFNIVEQDRTWSKYLKIVNGIDKADKDQIFQMNTDPRTRGHQMKLHKKQFRLDILTKSNQHVE